MAIGGAVVGAMGSVMASRSAAGGAEDAAQTTADTARYTADLQQEQYQQGRTDSTPYSQLGATAAPLLQYLTTGIMPTMTQADTDLINQYNQSQGGAEPLAYGEWYKEGYTPGELPPEAGYSPFDAMNEARGIDSPPPPAPVPVTPQAQYENYLQGYATGGEDVDQHSLANALSRQRSVNALQDGYQMQESPMYSWQQEQGERALNRQAAAKGLSGSRASLNALSDFNRGLGAQEADKQYGRLLDMTNIGRGMAATNMGAGQNYASSAGNALMSGASQSAMYSGQAANTKGSLYENIGQGVGQMISNYQPQQAYQNPFVTQSNPLGLTQGQGL